MSGRLTRGWSMARASYAVLRRYPKLAVLPVISGAIALSTIFQAGVYVYASTGVVPASLDRELIEGAFRRRG